MPDPVWSRCDACGWILHLRPGAPCTHCGATRVRALASFPAETTEQAAARIAERFAKQRGSP